MAKKKAAKTQPTAPAPKYVSIHPGPPPNPHPFFASKHSIPKEFADSVAEVEAAVGMPVWLLVQDGIEPASNQDSYNQLGDLIASAFFKARHSDLVKGERIALLIDSPGGQARPTYELAMLLRRHCGGFVAIIPRRAKSAATLLTLGADQIIMNDHAELGPLDVQMYDPDREDGLSGLDEVQSLERLQAFAMDAMDRVTYMLWQRTKKKFNNLIPCATDFVTKLTRPMFESIDVVRYTQMSRALKVAEEYGKRLLRKNYGEDAADIARKLVENYPEHGFPIYRDEVLSLGLKLAPTTHEMRIALEKTTRHLPNLNAIGRIL
jgi:hypothetical protein